MTKKEIVKILKGISHIKRYDFLEAIKNNNGISQADLVNSFKTPQTTAFFHLEKLELSGLIIKKQKKDNITYYPNNDLIKELRKIQIL